MNFDFQPLIVRLRELSNEFEFAVNHTADLEAKTRGPNGHPCDPTFLNEAKRITHEAHALSGRIDKFLSNVRKRASVEDARKRTPPPPST